jgi:hypothetical protein
LLRPSTTTGNIAGSKAKLVNRSTPTGHRPGLHIEMRGFPQPGPRACRRTGDFGVQSPQSLRLRSPSRRHRRSARSCPSVRCTAGPPHSVARCESWATSCQYQATSAARSGP